MQKPLTAKQKEKLMTVFGTLMIIALTVTSALSFDIRNDNLVQAMSQKTKIMQKG